MSKPLTIVSIGAGNVAHHFIPALYKQDCKVIQVYSRKLKNAKKLAANVDAQPIANLEDLTQKADLYLVMIHDDAIPEVITQLPELGPTQILAHTSGATSTQILSTRSKNFGSFYALQSFKKNKKENLKKLPFMINGNNEYTLNTLRLLADTLSLKVTEVSDEERLKYHLAAVMINNFSNHLACVTNTYLEYHHLDPEILLPITKATYKKILTRNPCENQTGPAIRSDNKVEGKHLEMLKDEENLKAIYRSMSESIKQKHNSKK